MTVIVRRWILGYNESIISNKGVQVAKTERRAIDKVFILLGVVTTAALVIIGGLTWYGHHFATNMVTSELSSQKIYFPTKGSPALTALPQSDQTAMSKYAGQRLVNGEQAKVYADHYIAIHLKNMANGKTYAEISAESMADPSNQQLQSLKNKFFQGQTLRGLLLSAGYSYWVFGMLAGYVAMAAFAGAIVMAILVLFGLQHLRKLK